MVYTILEVNTSFLYAKPEYSIIVDEDVNYHCERAERWKKAGRTKLGSKRIRIKLAGPLGTLIGYPDDWISLLREKVRR